MEVKLQLGDKTYKMPGIKAGFWFYMIDVRKKLSSDIDDAEQFEIMLETIARAFNHKDVTVERLQDELNLEEVLPLFNAITAAVMQCLTKNTEKIPNTESPAAG